VRLRLHASSFIITLKKIKSERSKVFYLYGDRIVVTRNQTGKLHLVSSLYNDIDDDIIRASIIHLLPGNTRNWVDVRCCGISFRV